MGNCSSSTSTSSSSSTSAVVRDKDGKPVKSSLKKKRSSSGTGSRTDLALASTLSAGESGMGGDTSTNENTTTIDLREEQLGRELLQEALEKGSLAGTSMTETNEAGGSSAGTNPLLRPFSGSMEVGASGGRSTSFSDTEGANGGSSALDMLAGQSPAGDHHPNQGNSSGGPAQLFQVLHSMGGGSLSPAHVSRSGISEQMMESTGTQASSKRVKFAPDVKDDGKHKMASHLEGDIAALSASSYPSSSNSLSVNSRSSLSEGSSKKKSPLGGVDERSGVAEALRQNQNGTNAVPGSLGNTTPLGAEEKKLQPIPEAPVVPRKPRPKFDFRAARARASLGNSVTTTKTSEDKAAIVASSTSNNEEQQRNAKTVNTVPVSSSKPDTAAQAGTEDDTTILQVKKKKLQEGGAESKGVVATPATPSSPLGFDPTAAGFIVDTEEELPLGNSGHTGEHGGSSGAKKMHAGDSNARDLNALMRGGKRGKKAVPGSKALVSDNMEVSGNDGGANAKSIAEQRKIKDWLTEQLTTSESPSIERTFLSLNTKDQNQQGRAKTGTTGTTRTTGKSQPDVVVKTDDGKRRVFPDPFEDLSSTKKEREREEEDHHASSSALKENDNNDTTLISLRTPPPKVNNSSSRVARDSLNTELGEVALLTPKVGHVQRRSSSHRNSHSSGGGGGGGRVLTPMAGEDVDLMPKSPLDKKPEPRGFMDQSITSQALDDSSSINYEI